MRKVTPLLRVFWRVGHTQGCYNTLLWALKYILMGVKCRHASCAHQEVPFLSVWNGCHTRRQVQPTWRHQAYTLGYLPRKGKGRFVESSLDHFSHCLVRARITQQRTFFDLSFLILLVIRRKPLSTLLRAFLGDFRVSYDAAYANIMARIISGNGDTKCPFFTQHVSGIGVR